MESFVAICQEPLEYYTHNLRPGVHIPMSQTNGRPKPLIPRVLCIRDDHFDVLELKKSILQEAGYKIVLAANGGRVEHGREAP